MLVYGFNKNEKQAAWHHGNGLLYTLNQWRTKLKNQGYPDMYLEVKVSHCTLEPGIWSLLLAGRMPTFCCLYNFEMYREIRSAFEEFWERNWPRIYRRQRGPQSEANFCSLLAISRSVWPGVDRRRLGPAGQGVNGKIAAHALICVAIRFVQGMLITSPRGLTPHHCTENTPPGLSKFPQYHVLGVNSLESIPEIKWWQNPFWKPALQTNSIWSTT